MVSTKWRKEEAISFRVRSTDRELLLTAASLSEQALSEFVRTAAVRAARRAVRSRTRIVPWRATHTGRGSSSAPEATR